VFGKKTGVLASILMAIIPGQFLQRSMLGFNDHHVWEAFWMVTSLALYVYALNRWKESTDLKKNLILATIAGIAFGFYLDTWAPGFAFGLIITTFIYLSVLLGFKVEERIYLLTAYVFIVASILYVPFIKTPFFSTVFYSPSQGLRLGSFPCK
jgi:dolichyl-diphosphooligosaccharide--protein glycosyltransferase